MIRVLIVDDHHLFAEGLKSMFKPVDNITIVAHTTNGNSVPHILEHEPIDVILMDIDMPVISGIDTMKLITSKGFDVPILVLTMHQGIKQVKAALEKGAQGYILKDASKSELTEAIRTTTNRQNYFHHKISDQVFNYFRGEKNTTYTAGIDDLTQREKEIIKLIAEGYNTKALADKLNLSEHTIKTHRRNIRSKLKIKTSAELIKLALEKGII